MDTKAIIRDIVATVVEGENSAWAEKGFFVVDVLCKGAAGDEIEVSLDCDGEQAGVGIEDCAQISREIGERLVERLPKNTVDGAEREADFSLTVMSAGLGQPLRLGRQYQKLMRRALERESLPRVDVLFKDGRKLNGAVLCGIGYGGGDADCPSAIEVMYEVKELLPGKKRKELVEKHEQIALEETKAVTEYFEFK